MNQPKEQLPTATPPILEIFGSHIEMGRQIGESLRLQVQHSIENTRAFISRDFSRLQLSWEGAIIQAMKYMYYSLETYPQYIDELRGIAEGANSSYASLAVLNAFEGITSDALHLEKCTSIATTCPRSINGNVIVGHNEDWLADDEADIFLVIAHPQDEPAFLAMSYGGLLPNIGFNEAGMAQCCDSVYPDDVRVGIPRVIVSRAVLAARSMPDAIQRTHINMRAAGYNHLLAHQDGEIVNVEVSASTYELIPCETGVLAHTNHYLSNRMQQIEKDRDELEKTNARYSRALHLLEQQDLHSTESFQAILRDHTNYPDSLCRHLPAPTAQSTNSKTIFSLIMDLGERKMTFNWGNPCMNAYRLIDPKF